MRISVNLASHPYVELRPIYDRLRTWMVILALLALALWFLYRSEHTQALAATARVDAVNTRVQQLEKQQTSYAAMMRQPQNAAILEQSDYLNDLFRRKAFSWTATMTDLETVLPSGVQVLAIDPIVAPDGHVTIRLRVTGARDRALDLIRNLERSKHFASPRLASETMSTPAGGQANVQNVGTNNDVNFDILADYRPLPLPSNAAQQEKDETGGTEPAHHARRAVKAAGAAKTQVERKPTP